MTLGCSESWNGQVFMSIAKFSLNTERRTRSHCPQWWEMHHRQVMRREITENSLAKAPADHCHCPFHLSLLFKLMTPSVSPGARTSHLALICLPQKRSAVQSMVGSSLETQATLRRPLPPLAVMGWNRLILLQGC